MRTQTELQTNPVAAPQSQEEKEAEHQREAVLGRQSLLAFWRDLAELMKGHYRQWAAYHGDERLGVGPRREDLWLECERRGLKPAEFFIGYIEYQDPAFVEGFDHSLPSEPE